MKKRLKSLRLQILLPVLVMMLFIVTLTPLITLLSPLTVKPSPELDLTYFMQRDILGDNALTPDVIEKSVPAEFALLINNKGNGEATNVRGK